MRIAMTGTNPVGAVAADAEAHARELEQRAAAAVDPCERERLLYLAQFARSGVVLPGGHRPGEASADRMDENGRQP